MLNQIIQTGINQVIPIIVAAIMALFLKEIGPVGDAVVSLLKKKEEDVVNKIGIDTYNSDIAKAKNIWNLVDEEFRITPTLTKTIEAAQSLFAEKILKVIPGISADDIEHLRQAVAGEINKGKEALTAPIEVKQVIQPTEKYVAPDGTELVKVIVSTEGTSDVSQSVITQ